MANGIHITERDGVFHLSGELNEYADLSSLLTKTPPLRLNLKEVTRINSIGIRNLLKFLTGWGDRAFIYEHCSSEFIDQVNMITSLLGPHKQGKIASFYVPYECPNCEFEKDIFSEAAPYKQALASGVWPKQQCPDCHSTLDVMSDSFVSFLSSAT